MSAAATTTSYAFGVPDLSADAQPNPSRPLVVAFDGDDTLWHNEMLFADVEERFRQLMAPWATRDETDHALIAHERVRVDTYGFGAKSFALSMIGTALDLSDGQVSSRQLGEIVAWGDELLAMPTELIDGARQAMQTVARHHPVYIITKGDLHHQLRRVAATDLRSFCVDVEIVADKTAPTYRRILKRHGIDPASFVMVGNSISSDVQPILDIGGRAIHVPYEVTWALEVADDPEESDRWQRADAIGDVPAMIGDLA